MEDHEPVIARTQTFRLRIQRANKTNMSSTTLVDNVCSFFEG